jgi:hypothetical protein
MQMSKDDTQTGTSARTTLPLKLLELDSENPRFGKQAGSFSDQAAVLDYIVNNFGVDTLLSSLAYNGYFDSEPIIVRPTGTGKYRVVEGNRRLSACLVLSGDERARNQSTRTNAWRGKTRGTEWNKDTNIPVRIYADDAEIAKLLPYLGVRHIVSSQPWDSYAKAKWIANVIERGDMTLDQISEVTGDKNKTIERLLEGYYFINQLISEGKFSPKQSVRRGRGSNPDFPFSWVYTLLDNNSVRQWLKLGERSRTVACPIETESIQDAGDTIRYLFGDTTVGKNPSISDSREIGLLAAALGDANKRALLREGKTAKEIEQLSKRPLEQLADQLGRAHSALGEANTLLASNKLTRDEMRAMLAKAEEVTAIAETVFRTIALGKPGKP